MPAPSSMLRLNKLLCCCSWTPKPLFKINRLETVLVPEKCSVKNTGKSLSEALIFLHQLTHNMTTDCLPNYKFST